MIQSDIYMFRQLNKGHWMIQSSSYMFRQLNKGRWITLSSSCMFTHLKFSENIESDEMKNGGSLKNPWRIMLPRHQRGNFHNDFVEGIE